eukprot:2444419-Rhodomonas_salina.3
MEEWQWIERWSRESGHAAQESRGESEEKELLQVKRGRRRTARPGEAIPAGHVVRPVEQGLAVERSRREPRARTTKIDVLFCVSLGDGEDRHQTSERVMRDLDTRHDAVRPDIQRKGKRHDASGENSEYPNRGTPTHMRTFTCRTRALPSCQPPSAAEAPPRFWETRRIEPSSALAPDTGTAKSVMLTSVWG